MNIKDEINRALEVKDLISDKYYWNSINKSFYKTLASLPREWVIIHFKTYPRLKKIQLFKLKTKKLRSLFARRSEREYIKKKISFNIFSKILFSGAGITYSKNNIDDSRRSYPSAGARYPLEVYIIPFNVEGIKEGLYHYNVKENSLELLVQKKLKKWLLNCTGGERWILSCNFIVIITGVPDRVQVKYGERGFRYMLIEIGHLAQNLLLISKEEGLGSCVMGGFLEHEIISLLDIQNIKEYPLYMISFGIVDNE